MSTDPAFRPTALLKKACPFCLKLRIGLAEIGVADRFEFKIVDEDEQTLEAARATLEAAGIKPSFPAVEVAPGQYITESDELIARYAAEAGVDPARLDLVEYYKAGLFARLRELFLENMKLKETLKALETA